jgi:predicted acylesterase/phospholipase RssA
MEHHDAMPKVQKAFVMQGGGALGAYEAGVFKALYDKFFNPDESSFFDVVAGVSIGAVNASILVSNVKRNRSWKGSQDILTRFWNDVSTPNASSSLWWHLLVGSLDGGLFKNFWDYGAILRDGWNSYWKSFATYAMKNYPWVDKDQQVNAFYFFQPDKLGQLASDEAARRYYASKQFLTFGTPNVLSPGMMQWDSKFLDLFNPSSIMLRFDNAPLARIIEEKYWPDNPIATSFEDGEPRLLFVSVDMQNCTTATFDSYEKKDDSSGKRIRRTIYGEDKWRYIIDYPDGIEMKHLMTSMSSHLKYSFPTLQTKDNHSRSHVRHFWDGVYLSNTPLRELLQAHHDYWSGVQGLTEIPKLQVYIVNLYPAVEREIPQAPDEIQDRQHNILFHDRSRYDEKVAHIVSDYIALSKRLRDLASTIIDDIDDDSERMQRKQELDKILDTKAKSMSRDGRDRYYTDLLDGRFEVEVFRIDKSADEKEDIFGKAFDFSATTIKKLLAQGETDAIEHIRSGRIRWDH